MEVQLLTPDVTHKYWTKYFDGSVMAPSLGARVVLISPDGSRLRYAIRLHFSASNNATEYEALINGLHISIKLSAMWLYAHGDSELVIDQAMKESSYKSPSWRHTAKRCTSSRASFEGSSYIMSPERTMIPLIFSQNWPPGRICP